MKNKFLLLLFFASIFAQAQFRVEYGINNTVLNDGDIITVSENNFRTEMTIFNTGSSPFTVDLQVVDIINTDGSQMEFCFGINGGGTCYSGMSNSQTYEGGGTLSPGAHSGAEDIHFIHHDNGSGTYPKDYKLKYIIRAPHKKSGVPAEIGHVNFTYRYDPGAGVSEFDTAEFNAYCSGGHVLTVRNAHPINLDIYSITGQRVRVVHNLSEGVHQLPVNFPSGIYFIHATGSGKQAYKKIVIK